jgi:hypothetical protein
MFDVLADVLELPCWGVKRGQGSFLTLEFGEPHLLIREPVQTTSTSPRVRRTLARRHVYVAGEWHLWLYCCNWRLLSGARVVGDSSAVRRVERAARHLDGQRLLGVSLRPRGARTRFIFDLGATLETWPYDRTSEQWHLYTPDGRVLTFRADRKYAVTKANETALTSAWRAA